MILLEISVYVKNDKINKNSISKYRNQLNLNQKIKNKIKI